MARLDHPIDLRGLLRDRSRLRERLAWTLVLGLRRGAARPRPRPPGGGETPR
jgi:hypothetical protein